MTIAELADRFGQTICEKAGLEEEVNSVSYGLEISMVLSISFLCIISIGALIGLFQETVYVAVSFLLMKVIIGGPHLSGFSRCISFSSIVIVGGAWLTRLIPLLPQLIVIVAAIAGIGILLYYAPLPGPNGHYSLVQKNYRKFISTSLLIASVLLVFFYSSVIGSGLLIGLLLSILSISPIGIFVVNRVEKLTKRR